MSCEPCGAGLAFDLAEVPTTGAGVWGAATLGAGVPGAEALGACATLAVFCLRCGSATLAAGVTGGVGDTPGVIFSWLRLVFPPSFSGVNIFPQKWNHCFQIISTSCRRGSYLTKSGQITIIPKPELRAFWKNSLTKPPFRVTSAEVVVKLRSKNVLQIRASHNTLPKSLTAAIFFEHL